MLSSSENLVICYNGEIYNHKKLKEKIKKEFNINFIGTSDTEVLLHSIELYGLDKTLKLIDGMYAFALWDNKNQSLYLVRDRFGEKPLYFNINSKKTEIKFLSELIIDKSNFELSNTSINKFFRFGYVPFNLCIYKNWNKVKPGEYIKIVNKKNNRLNIVKKTYWKPRIRGLERNMKSNPTLNQEINNFEKIFLDVISRYLISDVKTGTFLSSGIDSSLVTSFAKEIKPDIKSYTLCVKNDKGFDESEYSSKISDYLKVENEVFKIDQEEIIDNLKKCIKCFDEPFADSSQILSFILAKKVKKKAKVILTGDGADELFCGYNRHVIAFQLANIQNKSYLSTPFINNILKFGSNIVSKTLLSNIFSYPEIKLNKIKQMKSFSNLGNLLEMLILNNQNSINDQKNSMIIKNKIKNYAELFTKMMDHDLKNYLANDILVKVDRSTMYSGIEARAPFLSQDVYNFSNNLSYDKKIFKLNGKHILRKLLLKKIPKNLISQKKMGFSFSLEKQIFTKKNQKWLIKLFSNKYINNNFNISFQNAINCLEDHILKKKNNSNFLWSNVVMAIWLSKF